MLYVEREKQVYTVRSFEKRINIFTVGDGFVSHHQIKLSIAKNIVVNDYLLSNFIHPDIIYYISFFSYLSQLVSLHGRGSFRVQYLLMGRMG